MALAAAVLDAAARGDAARLGTLLRANPALVDCVDENGCSPLQRASADGHIETVQVLLQQGANPNKHDILHGNTPLHEASWKGYSHCVVLLAAARADLSSVNGGGFAPLHLACQNGHNQSCRELLLAGASPDIKNNYGDTPLHTAARYGHAGVTRILISAECKVSEQNKNGDTALHIAAAMGRRKLTRILLEAGCDKSLKNHQGETARDIATRKGLEEIINILNTPVAKIKRKDKRDKSKERSIDEVDSPKKNKNKTKKNVTFETPQNVQWSPYGCHYYPDPKYFPKPKLSSLPKEPLKKGEQYYLDLAGNIKKGPIGAGYTCYCAPFFKHMEEKLNRDKSDLKKHIDRSHDQLGQKVTDLEIKTQGQISQLTRFVAAERAMCKERHQHLEQWLTRGMMFRASERPKKLDFSPKGSLDIPPLKRTKSLEILDSHAEEWNKVSKIIQSFNKNAEHFDSNINEQNISTSKSTEMLDTKKSPEPPQRHYRLMTSKSSDQLDSSYRRSPHISSRTTPLPEKQQNVTAEIHVKANRVSVTHSPNSVEVEVQGERSGSSRQSNTKSQSSNYRTSDSEGERPSMRSPNLWRSQVLQKTADDIRKRVLEKEMSGAISKTKALDISQDGYVKFPKQQHYHPNIQELAPRKSVQELVAQVEQKQRSQSPEAIQRIPTEMVTPSLTTPLPNPQTSHGILKVPQQPQRQAPVLKEKTKTKRFSLQNLLPFPNRKSYQQPPKDNGNNSESSDDEDQPIRSSNQPGPMKNTNLLQTLPLPNFETISSSPSPAPVTNPTPYPIDLRSMVPKDAYFHDIPNRPIHHHLPYMNEPVHNPNEPGLPSEIQARNRNPIYHQTGVFDAMMKDHIYREMERIPQSYTGLDQNTELEISNQNNNFRDYYNNNAYGRPMNQPDHSLLHSRLASLAINTHLTESQSQIDRESHNDSGYSTKVYGSSQGPSPSLSGHVDDNMSGRIHILPNGKPIGPIGTSSLV